MDNNFLRKLSRNFLEILDDDKYYDVDIEVGQEPRLKVFRSHMVILSYRSPYLQKILPNKKKREGIVRIKLPNILPEIFQIILRYIYGGKLSLDDYDNPDIIRILKAANELDLGELTDFLQSFLIRNKSKWMEQNFDLVYKTSFESDNFLDLQKFCNELTSKEPEKIFNSHNFVSISEKSLISLITNENLKMSEVQIWGYVLKWGIAKNPKLPSDPSNYSKDDFDSLKSTLQKCITFIEFYNLSSNEFLEKVMPYKKILPKDLYKDLLRYFLESGTKQSKPRVIKVNNNNSNSSTRRSSTTRTPTTSSSTSSSTSRSSGSRVSFNEYQRSTITDESLIGTKLDIQKYEQEETYKPKIMILKERFSKVRRCLKDGDSFYRAFAFAWFERLSTSKNKAKRSALESLTSTTSLLESAGYQSMIFEYAYDVIIKQMNNIVEVDHNEDMILSIFQNENISNYIVYYLRLISAAYLKLNSDEYEPFLEFEMDMNKFCTDFVEVMGQGADNVQVIALSKALRVPLKIAYMSTGSEEHISYRDFHNDITTSPLTLLYRHPLHYDILYI